MNNLLGYDLEQLRAALQERSIAGYRVDQILQWVYQKQVREWDDMTNLSAELRRRLVDDYALRTSSLEDKLCCADGTVKMLLRWPDGAASETVLICDGSRRTVCVSSQVGCPVRCAFCASGLEGLERSLDAGEIVEQVLRAREQLETSERISNIVIMGMGEPLANYDATLKAVRILNADWALDIGARHITISTIGLIKQIRRLAREQLQVTLAVSLHAADDELRGRLIPWAQKTSLAQLFDAIDYYYQQTHREITLEYVLLEGVNCSKSDAENLARWAKRSRCNVNLIAYNDVPETGFQTPDPSRCRAFLERLQSLNVNVHLRNSRGNEISAACGQLRQSAKQKNNQAD